MARQPPCHHLARPHRLHRQDGATTALAHSTVWLAQHSSMCVTLARPQPWNPNTVVTSTPPSARSGAIPACGQTPDCQGRLNLRAAVCWPRGGCSAARERRRRALGARIRRWRRPQQVPAGCPAPRPSQAAAGPTPRLVQAPALETPRARQLGSAGAWPCGPWRSRAELGPRLVRWTWRAAHAALGLACPARPAVPRCALRPAPGRRHPPACAPSALPLAGPRS